MNSKQIYRWIAAAIVMTCVQWISVKAEPANPAAKPAPDTAQSAASDKAATEKAAAEKAAAEKAAAEKAAAEKEAADKAAAKRAAELQAAKDKAAQEAAAKAEADKARRQAAMSALDEVDQAIWDRESAERTVTQKTAAYRSAQDRLAREKQAARRAIEPKESAAKDSAEKALVAKAAASKAPDDKKLAEALASAEAAADKAKADLESTRKSTQQKPATAQADAEKVLAELKTAEKDHTAKTAAVKTALAKFAAADAKAIGGLEPLPADQWDYAKARHLLSRTSFGGTPADVLKLHQMGLYEAVEYLVDFHFQPSYGLGFDAYRRDPAHPDERMRDAKVRTERGYRRTREEGRNMQTLREWWARRLADSPRGMEEKLVLFWHNLFCSEYDVVNNAFAMYLQNELFRRHAADNYGALLRQIVHDPAMLRYLDNNRNVKGHPNENLAREIMELFSMGEGQGYSEQDIMEAARALTGYTYDNTNAIFMFRANVHDTEPKRIFGRTGRYSGDDLVDLILAQPSTARYISGKLFEYFAYEDPAPQTVEKLAAVMRSYRYEMRPVLKNLLVSREFYSSAATGTQIKSPVQLAVGMLRDLEVKGVQSATLVNSFRNMEQELFNMPNVKGWEGGRAWIDSNRVFLRYNTIADLIERSAIEGQTERGIDLVAVLQDEKFTTASQVVDHLIARLYAVPLDPDKRAELIEFVGDLPPSHQWAQQKSMVNAKLRALLVLLLTTPEYQLG